MICESSFSESRGDYKNTRLCIKPLSKTPEGFNNIFHTKNYSIFKLTSSSLVAVTLSTLKTKFLILIVSLQTGMLPL